MTENEKAATFIGWKPGICGDGRAGTEEWRAVRFCRHHQSWLVHDSSPALDMTDPRNYMKALDSIPDMTIERGADEAWSFEVLGPKDWCTGYDRDAGKAAVMALAALYDAEHPE